MALDLFIGVPILIAVLLGLRDGVVRKLVSLVVMLIAMYVAQITRNNVGQFLISVGFCTRETSATWGFLLIFFSIMILQSLIYRIVAKNYKINGIGDRIAGGTVGFIQGVIFISIILMVLAPHRFPSRYFVMGSQFYRPVVNVAPQLLDYVTVISEETSNAIRTIEKEISNEEKSSDSSSKSKQDKTKEQHQKEKK